MSAIENKQAITAAMEALAKGDSGPYYDLWADDFVFRQMGTGRWAEAYHGKEVARDELFRPLRKQYADAPTVTPSRIFADGDHVVVEARGGVTLKNGRRYENQYCFVIRMNGGKVAEVREYLDTALADELLEPLTP